MKLCENNAKIYDKNHIMPKLLTETQLEARRRRKRRWCAKRRAERRFCEITGRLHAEIALHDTLLPGLARNAHNHIVMDLYRKAQDIRLPYTSKHESEQRWLGLYLYENKPPGTFRCSRECYNPKCYADRMYELYSADLYYETWQRGDTEYDPRWAGLY